MTDRTRIIANMNDEELRKFVSIGGIVPKGIGLDARVAAILAELRQGRERVVYTKKAKAAA